MFEHMLDSDNYSILSGKLRFAADLPLARLFPTCY